MTENSGHMPSLGCNDDVDGNLSSHLGLAMCLARDFILYHLT